MEMITMTPKQLKRYKLAYKVIDGEISIKHLCEMIGTSYRQAQRIVKRVRNEDYKGVIHKNKGRVAHNKTSKFTEEKVIDLLTHKYNGFNLEHFREKAAEYENLIITKSTLHRIAKKYKLIKNPQRRRKKTHKPRPRLPQEGMLIQLDGSQHPWFAGIKSDLIATIDDATGKILSAEFFFGEKSMHSMKVIRDLIYQYGLPQSFYMDQAGIYGKLDRDSHSQISRALSQANIQLILASSPQAKGRIERLFRTLQDRLVAEMSFYNITTIDEANKYLKDKFIPKFNKQFNVQPEQVKKAYARNVFGNLERIFCKKEVRKVGPGNVFSWQSMTWVIESKSCYRGRSININTHIDNLNSFDIMGREVKVKLVEKRRIYNHNKKVA